MISSQPLIHCWQNTSWFTGRLEALLTDSELVRANDIGSIGCVLQLQLSLMQPAVGRICDP
jgi:hypothetical protein